MDAIKKRRSIRKYSEKTVSSELIGEAVRAAALAPSAKNRQSWKYRVYTGIEKEKLLAAM